MKLSLRLPRLEKIRGILSRGAPGRGVLARGIPREALFIAAVAVASAVITLIVLTASFNSRERRAAQEAREAQGKSMAPQVEQLSVDDFLLPAAPSADKPAGYYPFRPRLLRWSRENVEKFWVSPRRIATDTIGTINDRNMESMFEKVP